MNIEELKKYSKSYKEDSEKIILTFKDKIMLDHAACLLDIAQLLDDEIARQSVTDEDIERAIKELEEDKQFCMKQLKEDSHNHHRFRYLVRSETYDNYNLAITALRQMQGWIPCSERMPSIGQRVKIRKTSDAEEAIYLNENPFAPWLMIDGRDGSITSLHKESSAVQEWMVIPEPPKGEQP